MRRYVIGGIGLVMAALLFTVPTGTAAAHSPHIGHVGHMARGGHHQFNHVRPARPIARSPRHVYRPFRLVPPNARYPYWHYNRR